MYKCLKTLSIFVVLSLKVAFSLMPDPKTSIFQTPFSDESVLSGFVQPGYLFDNRLSLSEFTVNEAALKYSFKKHYFHFYADLAVGYNHYLRNFDGEVALSADNSEYFFSLSKESGLTLKIGRFSREWGVDFLNASEKTMPFYTLAQQLKIYPDSMLGFSIGSELYRVLAFDFGVSLHRGKETSDISLDNIDFWLNLFIHNNVLKTVLTSYIYNNPNSSNIGYMVNLSLSSLLNKYFLKSEFFLQKDSGVVALEQVGAFLEFGYLFSKASKDSVSIRGEYVDDVNNVLLQNMWKLSIAGNLSVSDKLRLSAQYSFTDGNQGFLASNSLFIAALYSF